MNPVVRTVDVAPLTAHVDRWDGQYLVDQVKDRPAYGHWKLGRAWLAWSIGGLLALIGGWVALMVAVSGGGPWTPGQVVLFAAILALVLVLYVSLAVVLVEGLLAGDRIHALARVIRFANRNGFVYEPIAPNREYPGPRFAGLYLRDRVTDAGGSFDYGQRLLPGRHGAHGGTSLGWYLAVRLPHPLPRALLLARGSRLVGSPGDTRQAVKAESGRSFELVCEPGGEAAAWSVLTPAVVSMLSENPACDAEIADRWLFVYPRRSTDLVTYGRAEFHRRMLQLAHALGADAYRLAPSIPHARHAMSGRVKTAILLVATVLPLVAVTVPFWAALAAAVSPSLR